MNKWVGWLVLGVGVAVAGLFGVKIYVDRKNEEKLLRELDREYERRINGEKEDGAEIYRRNKKGKTTEDKLIEQLDKEGFDLGEPMDLRIDDDEDLTQKSEKVDEEKVNQVIRNANKTLKKAKKALG